MIYRRQEPEYVQIWKLKVSLFYVFFCLKNRVIKEVPKIDTSPQDKETVGEAMVACQTNINERFWNDLVFYELAERSKTDGYGSGETEDAEGERRRGWSQEEGEGGGSARRRRSGGAAERGRGGGVLRDRAADARGREVLRPESEWSRREAAGEVESRPGGGGGCGGRGGRTPRSPRRQGRSEEGGSGSNSGGNGWGKRDL
ncbi:hypothetical protein BT93_F0131 [Corymbia citriodora subsp. variegata]|nr:hypothetical protein BT93_F0131 [Corymbia citriodora subsp. variegata]